jgi:hypothetical protein
MGGEGGRKRTSVRVGNSSVVGTPHTTDTHEYAKCMKCATIRKLMRALSVYYTLIVPRGAPFQRQLSHLRTVPVRQDELVIPRERHDRGREVCGRLEHVLDRQPLAPPLEGVPAHGYHYAIARGARGGVRRGALRRRRRREGRGLGR